MKTDEQRVTEALRDARQAVRVSEITGRRIPTEELRRLSRRIYLYGTPDDEGTLRRILTGEEGVTNR
jgi:hypothetical protein